MSKHSLKSPQRKKQPFWSSEKRADQHFMFTGLVLWLHKAAWGLHLLQSAIHGVNFSLYFTFNSSVTMLLEQHWSKHSEEKEDERGRSKDKVQWTVLSQVSWTFDHVITGGCMWREMIHYTVNTSSSPKGQGHTPSSGKESYFHIRD